MTFFPCQRPRLLTTVALFQGFISGLSWLSGLLLMLLITGQVQVFDHDLTDFSLGLKLLVVTGWLISSLGLAATVGLWQRQWWGWWASLAFQALCLVNIGLSLAMGQQISASVYVSVGVSGGLLVLLVGLRDRSPPSDPA